uniref:Cyclin-dependent kinase inhibitor 2C (p18, inhibits CDK4) n=1 Tax=Labrus bergylta TaxID=56723 RepID=A0A3Q3FKH3_9LABR
LTMLSLYLSEADMLCNASASGQLLHVLFLLENGADVNGFNTFNRTALQVVKLGNTALVEALLVAGADPNVPDPVLNLTVTHDAAREGFIDSVRVLVDHGANTNLVDGQGNLPLHLAAREGHLDVTQLLIECTTLNIHPDLLCSRKLKSFYFFNVNATLLCLCVYVCVFRRNTKSNYW